MKFLMVLLSLNLALLGSLGCARKSGLSAEGEAHGHETHEVHAESSTGISVESIRGLKLMKVPEARNEGRWLSGEAIGDESAQAILASPVKGLVSQILVAPGQPRAGGMALIQIQSPELARLKADWIGAKSRSERAQSDLAREERLFKAGAGSRRELETAINEAATAKAGEDASRLSLEAVGLQPGEAGATFTLKAPAPGSVISWKVQRGQGIEAGQELGSFQAAQAAVVRLELDQASATGCTPGTECQVRTSTGKIWRGKVEGVSPSLSADTRRQSIRLRLMGGSLPMPGSSVEVQVPMTRGIYLPQSAIQQMEGRWGLFVVEKGKAVFRPISRGADIKDEVLVLEGVKSGEMVVAEGAYLLKAYQQKQTEPEGEGGHGH